MNDSLSNPAFVPASIALGHFLQSSSDRNSCMIPHFLILRLKALIYISSAFLNCPPLLVLRRSSLPLTAPRCPLALALSRSRACLCPCTTPLLSVSLLSSTFPLTRPPLELASAPPPPKPLLTAVTTPVVAPAFAPSRKRPSPHRRRRPECSPALRASPQPEPLSAVNVPAPAAATVPQSSGPRGPCRIGLRLTQR